MRLRSFARLTTASVLLVITVAAAQGAASATEQDRITVAEGETLEMEYPPIRGAEAYAVEKYAGSGAVSPPTPEDCRTQSAGCDIIPVTIQPPAQEGVEFFVRFTLTWEAEPDPSGLTALQSNDLDMYLWHDPPRDMSATSEPDDPETTANEEQNNPGADYRLPERINYFSTEPGDYLLLVANGPGENTGYHLEVRYFPTGIDPPTGFTGVTDPRPAAPASSPAPPPAARAEPAPQVPVEPFEAPRLPVEPLAEDSDFESFGGIDLDDELAAPSDVAALQPASRTLSVADTPSSLSLVIWMAVAPLAVAAGLGVWLLRRRPGVLRLS